MKTVTANQRNQSGYPTAQVPDTRFYGLMAVASSTGTAPETLARLAGNQAEYIRTSVAQNPNTSSETLARLAGNKNFYVLQYVAQNPHTPPESLTQLADSEYWGVCSAVARNPNTPPEALVRLAGSQQVRLSVAANPNITSTLLKRIYEQAVQSDTLDKEFVCSVIQRNVLVPTELCALLAIYGEAIAQTIVNSVTIEPGSILEKQLASFGFVVAPGSMASCIYAPR